MVTVTECYIFIITFSLFFVISLSKFVADLSPNLNYQDSKGSRLPNYKTDKYHTFFDLNDMKL